MDIELLADVIWLVQEKMVIVVSCCSDNTRKVCQLRFLDDLPIEISKQLNAAILTSSLVERQQQ